jgi:hypothetical protein
VCPHPPRFWGGGAHSLAREGLGESQFQRGYIHCGTLTVVTIKEISEESRRVRSFFESAEKYVVVVVKGEGFTKI